MKQLTRLFFTLFKNKEQNQLFSFAFKESPVASLIVSSSGEILQINYKLSDLMGYSEKEILYENMSIFKSGKHDNAFYKKFWEYLLENKAHTLEVFNKDKNGNTLQIQERVQSIDDGTNNYFIVTFEDVTQLRLLEKRQQHLATHDPLTGLANRALLNDRYKHAALNAKRHNTKLAIIICDLNEFKQINDNYGHTFGDEVLKEVSKRLQNLVRDSDTVSRYGGDEFILVLEQIDSINIIEMQEEVNKKLCFDIEHMGESCRISSSIGYACFPSDGITFQQLVNKADMSMYDAKHAYYGF